MHRSGYQPPIIASEVLAGVLKDNKQAKILDIAAGTGILGEKVSRAHAKKTVYA